MRRPEGALPGVVVKLLRGEEEPQLGSLNEKNERRWSQATSPNSIAELSARALHLPCTKVTSFLNAAARSESSNLKSSTRAEGGNTACNTRGGGAKLTTSHVFTAASAATRWHMPRSDRPTKHKPSLPCPSPRAVCVTPSLPACAG